jgi:hypothetical protein
MQLPAGGSRQILARVQKSGGESLLITAHW